MPDPQKLTVSATQVPALWNASPYLTRWMLWQNLVNGVPLDIDPNDRMEWGTKMQPLILEQAAHDLKLTAERDERYVRRGSLGCTRDAIVSCPERGPGALEIKCVFDYKTWMREWAGGTFVPRHIDLQLQAQMYVGDGEQSFSWGVIAVWVAAVVYYFERQPVVSLWESFENEATSFLRSVHDRVEPDPFGLPMELPLLYELYPTREGSWLDLRSDEDESIAWTETCRTYLTSKAMENAGKKVAEATRAEMIAKLKGAEKCLLSGGASFGLGRGNRINVYVPEVNE